MFHQVRHALPYIVLPLAVGLAAFLGNDRRELRGELVQYRGLAQFAHTGMVVPTVRAVTLAGDSVTLGETAAGKRQVLFVFNTRCPYCLATLPDWKRVARQIPAEHPGQVEVYGIAVDSLRRVNEYVRKHAIDFPVVHFPPGKLRKLYRTQTVPLTMVLDSEGTALYAGMGSFVHKPFIEDSLTLALQAAR